MEDDEAAPEKNYPISTAKLSKTPSWIMLGFVLGAVFVAALPPFQKRAAPPPSATFRAVEAPRPTTPRAPTPISTIEAVFAEWGRYAVWSEDVTEVALWNSADKAFSDFYEVRRFGDTNYFRSIPALTRRIVSRGKPMPESPLQFTETEEQYREWLRYGRAERPMEREAPARPQFAPPATSNPSIRITAPTVTAPKLEPGLPNSPSIPPPSKPSVDK
jgi:hypothetical protein